jgi:lysophospholipase L1-like esterase
MAGYTGAVNDPPIPVRLGGATLSHPLPNLTPGAVFPIFWGMRRRAVALPLVAGIAGAFAYARGAAPPPAAAQMDEPDPIAYHAAAETTSGVIDEGAGPAGLATPSGPSSGAVSGIPLDDQGRPIFGIEVPVEDPNGTALSAFHAALRRAAAGEGQARVLVYGASHVAADLWTGVVRRSLQTSFGDAGHGFILPVEPWRHYRHMDITVTSNSRRWETLRAHYGDSAPGAYGLAGIAMRTDRAGAYGRIDTGSHTASRFEVWYRREPGGGSMDVMLDGARVQRIDTDGEAGSAYALVTAEDAPHVLELRARGDGPVTVYGATVERESPGVIVDTLGINGYRAAGHLLWDEAVHTEHLRRRAPDLVVLAYGTNESGDDDQPIEAYERDLRRVMARIQSAVPTASCMLVGPSDRPIVNRDGSILPRPRTDMVIEVQRRVAGELGCGFFDMVRYGGGPLHMVSWAASDPAWAQDDHIHYTIRGYTRLGDVMSRALLETYEGPILGVAPPAMPIATYVASLPSAE